MSRSPYDFPQPENPRAERLSALITCWIEIACCKGTVHYPVKLMLRHHPDRPLPCGESVWILRMVVQQALPTKS